MGWFAKKTVCPSCGQMIANITAVKCPQCKTKVLEVEPEIAKRVKTVSFWIAFYGWLQCFYWVVDTIEFFLNHDRPTEFSLSGWLYSFTRLVVGVALIYFARQAKNRQDKVASYLFNTMLVLVFKFFLMVTFDNIFYHFNIVREFGLPPPIVKPCGIGVLAAVFFYVVNQKKAIRELKQQRPPAPGNPTISAVERVLLDTEVVPSANKGVFHLPRWCDVKNRLIRNRVPIAVTLAVLFASAFLLSVFRSSDRYHLTTGAEGYTYRIDRATGETWLIRGNKMEAVKPPIASIVYPAKKAVTPEIDPDRAEFDSLISDPSPAAENPRSY